MSYRRTYKASISGSKTVSVGPSDKSQTITINYEHPFEVVIDVDTNPFDASVHNCSQNFNGLTAAVAASEAAQVLSVKNSSKKIGNAILQGFFNFISNDLGQQIKELQLKSQSIYAELLQQKKSCENKQDQMERDYQRITKRYTNLFGDLDKEMSNRIHRLCMPVFKVADASRDTLQQVVNNDLLGLASVASKEMANLDSVLKCSSMKNNMGKLITTIDEYIRNTYVLKQSVDEMLRNDKGGTYSYVPVAYVESTISEQGVNRNVYMPTDEKVKWDDKIECNIESSFQEKSVKWEELDSAEVDNIKMYFNQELSKSGVSPRVAQTINKLMEKNRIKTNK